MKNKKHTSSWIGFYYKLAFIMVLTFSCWENENHITLDCIEEKKVCIQKIAKYGRGYIYNDSIALGRPYYKDYANRKNIKLEENYLYPSLKVGSCILLTDHPKDSIYLIDEKDTTLYLNLYPKTGW